MKQLTVILFLALLLGANTGKAQVDDRSNNSNGTPVEGSSNPKFDAKPLYPQRWDKELKQAIESGNAEEEARLRALINEKTSDFRTIPDASNQDQPAVNTGAPYNSDWLGSDVLVYTGDIGQTNTEHRRLSMVMAEDGSLYAAYIARPVTGTNGLIRVHRSTNGGQTWTYVNGVSSTAAYFGQVSISVNMRGANPDSTRIHVFYSRSTDGTAFENATINWASFRRDGSMFMGGVAAATPTAGRKLWFPSAVSDGWYYSTATYITVVCGEYSNGGDSCISLRKVRTTDWGENYTTTSLIDGYPVWGDYYPSAAFKGGTTDSIYIAVERRFGSATPSITRIIATPFGIGSGTFRHSVPANGGPYEKPCITIVQSGTAYQDSRIILVSSILDNRAVYHRSVDGGSSWTTNSNLGTSGEEVNDFTYIASDTSQAGTDTDGNVVACYQIGGGDTIVVRRGIGGNLGTRQYMVNQFRSSIYNSPVTAVYNRNGDRFSALAYTGIVANYTSNVYFDGEDLSTGITSINEVAEDYSLAQNYPNPFNPVTNIKFSIPKAGLVKIVVYNTAGKEVATLLNGVKAAGTYNVDFDASKLSSGVYFYKITSGDFSDIKKMMLIK